MNKVTIASESIQNAAATLRLGIAHRPQNVSAEESLAQLISTPGADVEGILKAIVQETVATTMALTTKA